ncbi:MAG: hypothetical protein ACI87W_002199 [Halieaceae bacterium]|jgi:hypothetical protein
MSTGLSIPAKIALGLTALFGLLYVAIGFAWLAAPGMAAQALGASLLEGTGLAAQLGDSASFFLCSGLFMLYGVYSGKSSYLTAGALLIGLVAPARLIAWQLHGAALTVEPIIIEVLTFAVCMAAARAVRKS